MISACQVLRRRCLNLILQIVAKTDRAAAERGKEEKFRMSKNFTDSILRLRGTT